MCLDAAGDLRGCWSSGASNFVVHLCRRSGQNSRCFYKDTVFAFASIAYPMTGWCRVHLGLIHSVYMARGQVIRFKSYQRWQLRLSFVFVRHERDILKMG